MDDETKKQIAEIHAAVVKGSPANDELVQAARAVVDALDDHHTWHDLKNAIGELASVVERSKRT